VGLSICRIEVRNFRNYDQYLLRPDPSLTIVVGPNATGKTNLIEALQLLTEADSFRKPSWGEIVKEGQAEAKLELEASGDNRNLKITLEVNTGGRRVYRVNGKHRKTLSQVSGIIPCVIFTPDDLRLVKDSAEKRRGALDALGSQLSPSYAQLRLEYERVLRQRNSVLREGLSPEQLGPWTEQLILLGSSLMTHRVRLFSRMAMAMSEVYPRLSGGGILQAEYVPSWTRDSVVGDAGHEEMIRKHLLEKASVEAARRSSVSGPHRDEVVFTVEGREARAFASQGQQRTIALAWKLAEVSVITEIASQPPVLLLDDVMSELDERRRHALAEFAGSAAQTIITTTNLGYFEQDLLNRAKVVRLP
jgi:DNA replication and repair protein RecF